MKTIISDKIITLLNYRIEQEEQSSRLYKSMSNWLNYNGFTGAAKLWEKYSNEELTHAQWSYDYLLDLDIKPITPELPKPKQDFNGLIDIIQKSYDHELEITTQCQQLAKACVEENDFMTLVIAQKYLKEQTEEIAKTVYWLDRIEAFGDSKECLRLLDNEMSQ